MANAHWKFEVTSDGVKVKSPDRISPKIIAALTDLIFAEIDTVLENAEYFRQRWSGLSDPHAERAGLAGNGIAVDPMEDGSVELTSLYDQWEPVRMPKQEFELFLDEYTDFLRQYHTQG